MKMINLRNNQLPPAEPWKTWLLLAGRGFGKTLAGAFTVSDLIKNKKVKHIGIFGETIYETKQIMIEGISGLLSCLDDTIYRYYPKKGIILFENCKCHFFGANKFDRLRGFQFDCVWIDELAKFPNSEQVLNQINMCLRLGISKLIITTTPRPINVIRKLLNDENVKVTRGSTYDNKENLSSEFIKSLEFYKNCDFGRQEIFGDLIDTNNLTNEHIVYKTSDNYLFYIIGVDPAITTGCTGIILSAVDKNMNIYILDDFSIIGSVEKWVLVIKELFNKYKDKCEVWIEINQGGDMITQLLKGIILHLYRATTSKSARFNFVIVYYHQRKIFHTKKLKELEYEMLNSPADRVDALFLAVIGCSTHIS